MKLAVAVVVAIVGSAATARAEEQETDRYAESLVPMDVVAVTMVAGGAQLENEQMAGVGVLLYAASAPAVHLAKGNGAGALKSAGTRLALPLVGAAIGMGVLYDELKEDCDDCHLHFPDLRPAAIGAGVGMAVAIALDYTLFAKRRVAAEPRIAPTATASGRGFTVGVAGTW
jgi:hypothetical protein